MTFGPSEAFTPDQLRAEEYARGPTASIPDVTLKGLTALEAKDADPWA
jgi:hypothetical protein